MTTQELKQQVGEEFENYWNNEYALEGLPVTKDKISSFIDSIIDRTVQHEQERIVGKVIGLKKYHKEFECNGAHNGKGCYEDWCEDQNCRNAPKEYNQAIEDLKSLITNKSDINK